VLAASNWAITSRISKPACNELGYDAMKP
jgi:hypothetical protein